MADTTLLSFFLCIVLVVQTACAFISLTQPLHHNLELFSVSTSISAPFENRRKVSSSLQVKLLEPIGNGTFGGVYWAEDAATGKKLVAKTARAVTTDEKAHQNAKSYLEIEAYINSKLCNKSHQDAVCHQHIAPYLGEIKINQTLYLIWQSSGEYTLEDYIEMDDGWVQLAYDLGIPLDDDDDESSRSALHQRFAKEVLRQLLEGIAYCHSLGVIHRDIKPANVLVDPHTKSLRLIDFGSACDMSSWTAKAGYRGQNKGPRSILYCAPEEFVNEEYPYAFDIYGLAITWLRTVLSEDGAAENGTKQSFGLGDEDNLFKWRLAVRDFSHNLVSWEEYAVLHNNVPYGWDSLFGSSREGIYALRLLSSMMHYSPAQRISASEALLGAYLNSDCSVEMPPELPPAMPWSLTSHVQRWKKEREVLSGECRLESLFADVIAVEIELPIGLELQERENGGAQVVGVEDPETSIVQEGDSLVAIGSIDVESVSLEHINELIDQWPRGSPVPLLLMRDSN